MTTFHEIFIDMLEEKIEDFKLTEHLSNKEIDEKVSSVIEKVFSDELLSKHAKDILNTLEPKAPIMYEENRLMMQEFESRLQRRWLDALYISQLFLTITTESTVELMEEIFEAGDKNTEPNLNFIPIFDSEMLLLQKQSIVLAKEMLVLIKSGFSEAAFSRWRSLFEVSVIMKCFVKVMSDEESKAETVAKEFYISSIIREKKILLKKKKSVNHLVEEIDKIDLDRERKEKLHIDYEWARNFINIRSGKKIYFNDLIDFSELNHLKNEYQDACQYIHISPYGLHYQISQLSSNDKIVFGPTDYGLSRPLQLLLISLLSTTTNFLTIDYTIDRAIQIKMLNFIIDDSLELISNIDKKILDEFYEE